MMALRRGGHSGLGLVLGKAGCPGRGDKSPPGKKPLSTMQTSGTMPR